MTEHLTEDEVIAAIPGLTRTRLIAFVQAEVVLPTRYASGHGFARIDVARLRLLCDLADDLEFDTDGLAVVMSLIDQLHRARRDMTRLVSAIDAEPAEVRARISAALQNKQG